MSPFEKIIPGAFLVCVALTACTGERTEREGVAQGRVDTVAQPAMPAPSSGPAGPAAMQGKDSEATAPLSTLDTKKENTAMPEALHGNNHSSPSVGSNPGSGNPGTAPSPLKKSSTIMLKSPKVIWV